jgi:hypothetical protein
MMNQSSKRTRIRSVHQGALGEQKDDAWQPDGAENSAGIMKALMNATCTARFVMKHRHELREEEGECLVQEVEMG